MNVESGTESGARPVALVTGGSRGQGAAHARALTDHGFRVVVADVLDEAGESLAAQLRATGCDVRYVHLDVCRAEDWARVVREISEREGRLDALVNNAGIIRVTPLLDVPLEEWERLLQVNATSMLLGIQAVAPVMAERGGGAIVNVASTAAHRAATGYAAYSASKALVLALTRSAALELAASGIRVNSISPGGVDTPMNDDEPAGGTSSGAPLGRRATPEEISPTIIHLVTEASSYMTGTDVLIDGGVTLR